MPLAVLEIVGRVVTNAVLISQFRGDLIENVLNLATAILRPTSRQQPGLSSTGIRERLENVHVHGILTNLNSWPALRLKLLRNNRKAPRNAWPASRRARERNRKRNSEWSGCRW